MKYVVFVVLALAIIAGALGTTNVIADCIPGDPGCEMNQGGGFTYGGNETNTTQLLDCIPGDPGCEY